MKNGFTLVELSIVLVIIGLLIGGILVGQSLIGSAKLSAQVTQLSQFDSASILFESKYKALPGDYPAFGEGNGNGVIDRRDSGSTSKIDAFHSENSHYWTHLFLGKYEIANWTAVIAAIPDENVPAAKMGSANSFVVPVGHAINNFSPDLSNKRNYFMIFSNDQYSSSAPIAFRNSTSGTRAFKPIELLSLDRKLDDSQANSGSITAGSINGTWPSGGGPFPNVELTDCSSGADYVTANDSYNCTPFIRIGGLSGNPL